MSSDERTVPERLRAVMAKAAKYILDDDRAAAIQRDVERSSALKRANELMEIYKREGVPLEDGVRDAILRGKPLRPTQSVRAVERWLFLDNVPPVLVLSGPTGCGKSVAAAYGIALALRQCRWRYPMQVLNAFGSFYSEAMQERQRLLSCRLLVLDEVGTGSDPERFALALLALLEARKQASVYRTIITTNLSPEDFAALYPDERLQSRMSERCRSWVSVTDPDLRKL